MFSLIITIISIALVAALAVATLYFGGDAFTQGSARADASAVINQAQQIDGANTLFAVDSGGDYATALGDLTTGGEYLASEPTPPNGASYSLGGSDDPKISLEGLSESVCDRVNEEAGIDPTSRPADVSGVASDGAQFGCYSDDSASPVVPPTFVFNAQQ